MPFLMDEFYLTVEFEFILVQLAEHAFLIPFVFEHDEEVILVLGRVFGVTEHVTGFPEDVVNFVLGDGGWWRESWVGFYLNSVCYFDGFLSANA